MKCKDFSIGDNVIIQRTRSGHITEDKVIKVGRKYVTTERGYRFNEDKSYEFSLANRYQYGESLLLFKDNNSMIEHQNKKEALSEIRNMIGRYQLEYYKKIYIDKVLDILCEGAKDIQ